MNEYIKKYKKHKITQSWDWISLQPFIMYRNMQLVFKMKRQEQSFLLAYQGEASELQIIYVWKRDPIHNLKW